MRSFPAIEDPRLSSRAQPRDLLFALRGRTFTSGTQRSPGITGYAVLDDSTYTVTALISQRVPKNCNELHSSPEMRSRSPIFSMRNSWRPTCCILYQIRQLKGDLCDNLRRGACSSFLVRRCFA